MLTRTYIINYYLSVRTKPTSYLEIGIQNPKANFDKIVADKKDGVDPNPDCKCEYIMTSDQFFEQNMSKYDVIFIDGDHTFGQVYKDVINSLNCMKIGGIIVMHDCNPPTEWHQRKRENVQKMDGPWNGTVWKAFVKLRCENSNLKMFVIDTDCGVGIIIPNQQQYLFSCDEDIYDYNVFDRYRKKALNLISENEWLANINEKKLFDDKFVKIKCQEDL